MQAILALEDGRIFRGRGFGAPVEAAGEVVFNTSLTGYQEIFTDPSYAGQIVVLTNPHIGNYGTTPSDAESARPFIEGLVTREFSAMSSNWRSTEVADDYLERSGIPVIAEVDTRAVVRHLRTNGVMRGVIASGENLDRGCAGGEGARDPQDGRHGPGQRGHHQGRRTSGTRASRGIRPATGCCRRTTTPPTASRCMSSRTTSASSRTSCAC